MPSLKLCCVIVLLVLLNPDGSEEWALTDIWNQVEPYLPATIVQNTVKKVEKMIFFKTAENEKIKEEIFYTMFQFVSTNNYRLLSYYVTTEDGYILQLFRIPHGKNTTKNNGDQVVLLQHGFSCSSEMWVSSGPNNSLAFYLADQGYDVWMSNFRGNIYGRNHTRMNPDISYKFWEFGLDEHGRYDLPAVIDFVLDKTNQPRLLYIGHSTGNKAALILLSTKTEYNSKLEGFIALACATTSMTYGFPIFKEVTLNLKIIHQLILVEYLQRFLISIGHNGF